MKKVLKIISIVVIVLFVIIILLSVVAKIKEKEIADIALKRISKSIHAPLVIDDISLNLIRRFPLATVELKGVLLGSHDAFGLSDSLITEEETLVNIEKVFVSVKSRPLFRGEFEIMKVEIKGVDTRYIVDRKGISNFDFLFAASGKESDDTSAISLNVILKELLLRDIHCYYYDSLNIISAQLVIPRTKLFGEIRDQYLHGSAKGVLNLSNCNYKATNLNLMKEMKADFEVVYAEDSVELNELTITTDGADFDIDGNAVIKDTIETDVEIQANHIDLEEIIKYMPAKMFQDLGLKKVSGIANLNASIKGFISDSTLPEVNMDFEINNGYMQKAGYPSLRNISLAGYFTNGRMQNNTTTSIDISKFHAETQQSRIDLSGTLNNLDHIQYKINSEMELELREFKEFVPDTLMQDVSGSIQGRLITKGVLPDSIGNDFIDYLLETSQLDLYLSDLFLTVDSALFINSLSGRLEYDLYHLIARGFQVEIPSYGIKINNASFNTWLSGKTSDLSKLVVDLNSFRLRTNKGDFYGSLNIRNLKEPEYDIKSNARLYLGEIKKLLPDTLVSDMTGEIKARIISHGKLNLDSIQNQINELVFENSELLVNLDKVTVDMPDTLMSVTGLSGELLMKPDTITINNFHGMYNGIDFIIDSTKIMNLYSSVIKKQGSRLNVYAQFNLGDLNYTMFAPFITAYMDTTTTPEEYKDASDTAETAGSTVNNFTFNIKGKLGIKSMTYKKAYVENISGLFNLSDSIYLIDQLKFNGFDGKHNTSVRYEIREEEEQMLWVKNIIEKMNVTRLLKDFDNFEEFYKPEITYENISGILTSKFDAQIFYKGDSMMRNEMRILGDIKIEKGGIYNYQLVKDMAQHLPGIDNLDVLEFKTINSNIFVFKGAVYVPTTLVVSNKLDASALGMQTFGEDYSYHFIVFLSDIIYGKSDRRKRKQDKIGEEITSAGRKGTLVKSYSLDGKSRSGLDNKKDQQIMRDKVSVAEGLLKLRFHPKLVSYETGVK